MSRRDYPQMLLERIETTFSEWWKEEYIMESELYRFLHTLKGTSGTIGLEALSAFCSSHLAILTPENESRISVSSLENLSDKIRRFLDGTVEENKFTIPEIYHNRFDEETFFLVIDDDLEFVTYVKGLLETMGAQVIIALNGKRGIEQFYSMRPNFVLIDLYLSDMSGFDVLDQIGDIAMTRHVVVTMTSTDHSTENRIQAYEKGAMDFISKPLNLEIFLPYLFNRDAMRKTIGKSIVTDGLTGVGNRRYFDEMIRHFAELSNRSGVPFSFVMIDLDHFKKINDQYGHPAGDEVLQKLGEVVMEEKREVDYVFRYGGEEFAFLLSGITAENALALVERVRVKFNALRFQGGNHPFAVTFSAGISTYAGDIEKLISTADQALYKAKRSGRNQTVIFDEKQSHAKRKLNIMIVDDDRIIRTILQEKLMEWIVPDIDISVQAFSNGPSFLEADWYSSEENYIVLLDGIMPEMDGLEVLSRLKKRGDIEKNVLVSMMTARTEDSDIKAALWLGADDYIMKPFQSKDVLARVQQLANKLFN